MAKTLVNAWREILARILDGFEVEPNPSPAWLVNPATKRPLKLDLLYPEIGLAIRFSGLRGSRQRRRQSPAQKRQQRARDAARRDVCQARGISLALLDLTKSEPYHLFDALELAMSRASRRLKKDETIPPAERSSRLKRLRRARGEARRLRRNVKSEKDLNLYLDLWRDRQFREAEAPAPSPAPQTTAPIPPLAEGMFVEHAHFGPGIIQSITPGSSDSEALITIRFDNAAERTFMAGLVADKLKVQ